MGLWNMWAIHVAACNNIVAGHRVGNATSREGTPSRLACGV